MITKEYLARTLPETIFQEGIINNGEYGVKISGATKVRFAAIKGWGYHDWAIYADDAAKPAEEVVKTGQNYITFTQEKL